MVTSHPVQYHARWFQALAHQPMLDFHVLYCHRATPIEQSAAGFGVPFQWDTPLLEGYSHDFLRNVSKQPGIGTFSGLDTPELKDRIRARRYDAVVVNGWHYKSAWQAIRSCWKSGVPVLVRSDSHLRTPRHPIKQGLKAIPYRWFIPRLDACLAVGQWSADYFVHYGARSDRVFIVPHTVDPSFEHDSGLLMPRRLDFRRAWGLEDNELVFLYVGKFNSNKRPGDFVRAIEIAHRRNPRIAGLMVGDGPLRGHCESLAEQHHLPIRFTGFLNQSQIVRAYIAADAMVVTSDDETWGVVINEAMTCGLPCLVSERVGCTPDLISPGQTGFVFPPGDVAALSSHMVACADRAGQLSEMGKRARERMTRYSTPVAVDALVRALQSVAPLAGTVCG
jgi:glycosyltransferase involved in cell wall biosynthesis